MALNFITILFVCLCTKWSKCMIVETPVKRNDPNMAILLGADENLETIESLAASKILMDHTSAQQIPANQKSMLKVNHQVLQTTLPSNPENNEYNVSIYHPVVTKLNIKEKEFDRAKNLKSRLEVARCRAACFKKFTRSTRSNLEHENQAENIKGSIGRKDTFTIPNEFSTACLALTKCQSCWKSCKNIKPGYYSGQDETSTILSTETVTESNLNNNGDDVKSVINNSESETQLEKINPFNLRLESLTRQNLLVIAELKWNEIGDNPKQKYQVTWELIGGGLKGHLVTDSISVTLSLWPDTTYTIGVETFQQKSPDLDGKPPTAIDGRDTQASSKSLQLTVDTSGKSSKKNEHLDEEGYYNDEFVSEEDEAKEELLEHNSVGEVLGVLFASLLLMFVFCILVLFVWDKSRLLFTSKSENSEVGESGESDCFYNCFVAKRKDTKLVECRDTISSDESSSSIFSIQSLFIFNENDSQCVNKKNASDGLDWRLSQSSQQFCDQLIVDVI